MKRVFAHIGFSFAITMLVVNLTGAHIVKYILAGLAVILIASLAIKKYRQALAVPVCLGAAVFACIIFMISYNSYVVPEHSLDGQTGECEFYLVDLPEQKSKNEYVYTIKTKSINLPSSPQNIKLRLKTKKPINCEAYRIIKGELTFKKISDNAMASFGYWGKDIFLSSKAKSFQLTDSRIKSPMRFIINARKGIKDRLGAIPDDEGALSKALLIGDKSDISPGLYNDFRISGVSHLMAVSGLHLSAVSGFILLILKKLRVKEKAASLITIAVILYYCALCGFSKSVVRAGIMMGILTLGKLFERHSDTLNSLGLATFIICINPFAVCDIGAILSILSVLAICTAFPYFNKRISRIKMLKNRNINSGIKSVLKTLALTFCIFAYQLPAMFVYLGYISLIGLISGLILVPIGSASTILSLISNIAIKLKIGLPFAILCKYVNKIIIFLVGKFAALRFLVVNFENYFGIVIAILLIIFALCFIINRKLIKKAAVLSLAVVVISLSLTAAMNSNASYIYISQSGAAAICSNNSVVVFNISSKNDYYSIRKFLYSRSEKIDCIIAPKNSRYSKSLSEEFNCKSIHTNTYGKAFSENFKIDYKTKGNAYSFSADIYSFCLTENSNNDEAGDINIDKGLCRDKNGIIDLSKGDILYRISDKNYTVRRVNIWQE